MQDECNRTNESVSFLVGMVLGATVGALAGVLLAPQSGKQTRDQLQVEGKKAINSAKTSASEFSKQKIEPAIQDMKSSVSRKAGDIKEQVSKSTAEVEADIEEKA